MAPDASRKGKRMSPQAHEVVESAPVAPAAVRVSPAAPDKIGSWAALISALTLLSRVLGMVREMIAARYFGAGLVQSAFTVAFTIPNIFRRLFGEGALSAAFIPLYSEAVRNRSPEEARRFASSAIAFLAVVLTALTIIGELLIWAAASLLHIRSDHMLAVKLTAILLPYALLVCGMAFLSAILQVHRRFAAAAAAPVVLNVVLIVATLLGAQVFDLRTQEGQRQAIYLVSLSVLAGGVLQVLMLVPSLRGAGFRFTWGAIWTPAIRTMVKLSLPVALGAVVMQVSVLLDRAISLLLAQGADPSGALVTHFGFLGWNVAYPMEHGAAARLAWAQYVYQFPLGVFAIALATAVFPTLSSAAIEADRLRFGQVVSQGLRVALWEGLPASVGLAIVAPEVVRVLFEGGRFGPRDTELMAGALRVYALGIWAFSIQQIINRAYYALHDMTTPLVMSIVNLAINLAVEIPLLWPMGEAGMAAGTTISFTAQSLLMLWMLNRKTGGLQLGSLKGFAARVLAATAVMAGACLIAQRLPIFPADGSRMAALVRLVVVMTVGAAAYLGVCAGIGVNSAGKLLRRAR